MKEPVFERQLDGIDDDEWLELLEHTSGRGRHFFTANQLYTAYARNKVIITRYIAKRGRYGLVLMVVGLAIWIYALKADWGITLVLGIACTLSGVGMVGTGVVTRRDPAAREPIERWLSKWTALREVERLIMGPKLVHTSLDDAPPSARCLIIVERDELVDLLLKNGAQRELSALIVAESGYPEALTNEARRLLDERSDLKVVLLHDATPAGVAMPARLQKSKTLPLANRELVDAGLFPADVTWLAELAPAIPAGHINRVPVDSLSYEALLIGLRGIGEGALSLATPIREAAQRAIEGPALETARHATNQA